MSVHETPIPALVIALFGPIEVRVHGRPLPVLRSRKALWLLALLALRSGRSVEREWLAGTLWPDTEQSLAFNNLRVVLSELRKALGEEGRRLRSPDRHTLSLDSSGAEIDARDFDAAIGDGSLPALERAVTLYRGPLLEGCPEEWVFQEREKRAEDCLRALQTLGDAALEAGDPEAAVGYYRRAVGLDSWRETARRGLMDALARTGDRNAALQVYREYAALLREIPEMIPDEETHALYTRLRAEASQPIVPRAVSASAPPIPVVTGYVPHALTELIGREDERIEVADCLRRSRLVTLTGVGGIGKTRLALALARDVVREYADGVWLVALDSLSEDQADQQVFAQIASVLGLREERGQSPSQCVTEHLRQKQLLLVLDNCEHLLEAGAEVADHLLRECGDVRILATSRETLGITGEMVWKVPALAVPEKEHLPEGGTTLLRVLMGYESVQLFVERAQAVQESFHLTHSNVRSVAQVCQQLEGIPLAIELAAARIRALTVEQIAARLDHELALLTGGDRTAKARQQTLRATLDWSYDLLIPSERLLLRRVSIFAGGWSLETAEAICTGEGILSGEVMDLLASLVDKSLVIFVSPESEKGGSEGRYRLLEMVRQYAYEQLQASAEETQIRIRHRGWYCALAEEAEPLLRSSPEALVRVETDYANLCASMAWSESNPSDKEEGLRIAGAIWFFWHMRGRHSEGRQLLQQMLESGTGMVTVARAKALNAAGTLAYCQGDYEEAGGLLEASLRMYRELGDRQGTALALRNLATLYNIQRRYFLARTLYTESLDLFRTIGDREGIAWALHGLGNVALYERDYLAAGSLYEECLSLFKQRNDTQGTALSLAKLGKLAHKKGEYTAARDLYQAGLSLFQQLGDRHGMNGALNSLGLLFLDRSDYTSAQTIYEESVRLSRSLNDRRGMMDAQSGLAEALLEQGKVQKAVRLWRVVLALRDNIGMPLTGVKLAKYKEQIEKARLALSAEEFAVAWEEGGLLTWEQAATYALSDSVG